MSNRKKISGINPVISKVAAPVEAAKTSRYHWDFSNYLTTNIGRLTPIICDEVLPKDTWRGNVQPFLRAMPLLAPIMHDINVYTHFFFVPYRILFKDWEKFISKDTEIVLPYVDPEGQNATQLKSRFGNSTLADYLGLSIDSYPASGNTYPANKGFSALPFLAYQAIYNHYYWNKNFDTIGSHFPAENYEDVVAYDDFSDTLKMSLLTIRNRNFEPDYFTSALPWPQRGDSVLIPFTGSHVREQSQMFRTVDGNLAPAGEIGEFGRTYLFVDDTYSRPQISGDNGSGTAEIINNAEDVVLDVSRTVGNAATIEDLRLARLLQRFNEISGNAEDDYQGQMEALWGVRIPDYRANKPEFIGGGRQVLSISEVLQTSSTVSTGDDKSPQGNMSGHAVSAPRNGYFEYHAFEYGLIIGIMSIMPRSSYSQGLKRMYFRKDRFDFAWPQFASLGAQEIYNKELFNDPALSNNDGVFGYTERYMDMKIHGSEFHGEFKPSENITEDEIDYDTNLSYWHLGRSFSSQPNLGTSFLECDGGDFNYIFADQSNTDKFLAQVRFNITCDRGLPMFNHPLV